VAWYWWVLIWVGLVLAALGVLALLGLSLWRRVKLLGRELATASRRFAEVSAELEKANEKRADPAIFTPATQLRQERFIAARARQRVR
jgi:hypothetical protein